MKTLFRWTAPGLLGLSLGACNLTEPACTLEARVAVQVDVTDAATHAPVNGATLILRRDGRSAVDVQEFPGPVLVGGYEAGTYHVTVRKAGYQDWTREDVRVREEGRCNKVQTRFLTAELVRAP